MVRHVKLVDRNLVIVNVEIPGHPKYDVHIQIDEVTVLPIGNKTTFVEHEGQKEQQIKHILVEPRTGD